MSEVRARYFDGESARQFDAIVQIGPENIIVRDERGGVLAVWPADEVRLVGKPAAGRPLRLGRNRDVARIVIADTGCLSEVQRLCANLNKLRPGLQEVWRPIALWGTVAIASIAFILLVIIPYAARQAAAAIPPEVEVQLGEAAADQIVKFFTHKDTPGYCSSPAGDRALDTLTRRFTAQADLPFPLHVRIVESPIVNAFALPGGQIIMFSKLLEFAESPEEVAGVLAHEVGHVVHRHPMEVFVKNVGAATLIGFLLGDITGGSVIGALAQLTVTSAYTRDAERQADAEGVALLNGAGIDGSGLVDFFERLRKKSGAGMDDILKIVGTHPTSGERSDFVRAHATAGGPAMSDAEWAALKAICGGE